MFEPIGRLYALNCGVKFTKVKEARKVKDSAEALSLIFDFAKMLKEEMLKIQSISNLLQKFFFKGSIGEEGLRDLLYLLGIVREEFPLELKSPFESCDDIEGNYWKESEYLNRESEDAILHIKWHQGAIDLPSHVHRNSDRVIMLFQGEGSFYYNFDKFEDHQNLHMQKLKLQQGDILCFPKDFVHSFSSEDSDMELLSYHSPFVELDDPKQYDVTKEVYYPRMDQKK